MKQKIIKWWYSRNVLFSAFTHDNFTNREVVLTHAGFIAVLAFLWFALHIVGAAE